MLACGTVSAPRDQKLSKSQQSGAKCAYALRTSLHLEVEASVSKALASIFSQAIWRTPAADRLWRQAKFAERTAKKR